MQQWKSVNIRERLLTVAEEIQSRKAFAVLENIEEKEAEEKDACVGKDNESHVGKNPKQTQPKQSKE